MLLAKVDAHGNVLAFPYGIDQLKRDQNVALPANVSPSDLLALGAEVVETPPPPACDPTTQRLSQAEWPARVAGTLTLAWSVEDRTPEEIAAALAEARAAAERSVDAQAEARRALMLTPGSGQALEYDRTEREARAYAAAGFQGYTAALYPMIEAERLAVQDATGVLPAPQDTAQSIITLADASTTYGAAIKRVRRSAKLALEAATTLADVRAALDGLEWPAVP